jgi:HEPN domain-containing protein
VTKRREVESRLGVARRYLEASRQAAAAKLWREAAANARAGIENALKALLARRGPVPRTHDPHLVLQRLLDQAGALPEAERQPVAEVVRIGHGYGLVEPLRLSTGDESRHLTPWDFAPPAPAASSLRDAEEVLRIVEALCKSDNEQA